MLSRNAVFLVLVPMLFGCSVSSLDAKKSGKKVAPMTTTTQLTDKDVFGNETTLNISEENIQDVLGEEQFSVPLNSSVVLVQSGSLAPDAAMQQEVSKYYKVTTFSGIPDKKNTSVCNKDAPDAENINYMQALRYIAAKGRQKAVLVYWNKLETGKYDPATKEIFWSEYRGEKLTGTGMTFRYLLRFALTDVATGEWVTYSPMNYEFSDSLPVAGSGDITEQQINQLRKKTYERAVADLVSRYK